MIAVLAGLNLIAKMAILALGATIDLEVSMAKWLIGFSDFNGYNRFN